MLLIHFALPFRLLPPRCILIVARPSDPIQRQRIFAEFLQLIRSKVPLQPICLVRDDPDVSLYITEARVLTVERGRIVGMFARADFERNATERADLWNGKIRQIDAELY